MRHARPTIRATLAASSARVTALTTVLITALAAALAAGPADASGPLPEPIWQSSWEAQGDPDEARVYLIDSVLDPVTGDVFALARHSEVSDRLLLRRVDGETGATEWERPQDASAYSRLTLDADARQLLLFEQVSLAGRPRLRLHALGVDGEPRWSRDLGSFGYAQEQVTDPASGTTCTATVTARPRTSGSGSRRGLRWTIGCVARDGEVVALRSLDRSGSADQDELGLAVDSRRGRWYAALSRVVPGRSSTVEVQALDQHGRTRWRRTLTEGPREFRDFGALTVDPKRGRVLLGTSTYGGGKVSRGALTVWEGNGRRHAQRTWHSPRVGTISDLAVSQDGRHYVVASLGTTRGATITALRPSLRQRWTTRHTRQPVDHLDLVLDDAQRRILVAGGRLAAYRWNGSPTWAGRPVRTYLPLRLHLDTERQRLVSAWQEDYWPAAHLTAWQLE
ncbi:hypothetical protein [Nocardioides campestrisoli]|uniref:hypothetical protein n=1 Tax=Nocardioides campestrisoli TaxID=2736757 RepID=UPI00163D4DD8|nr:hypothetical protein [Nocardioides campestrisoli]